MTANPSTHGDADSSENGQAHLSLQVERPRTDAVVLTFDGEIDEATTEHVAEVLSPRLVAALRVIVLDMSDVTFLGVAGLHLLDRARTHAHERGYGLRVVATHHEVVRALRAAELEPALASTVTDALAAADADR